MNIDKVNFNNVTTLYKSNRVEVNPKIEKRTDTVEISDLGKYLNKVNTEKKEVDIDKVNELRKQIESGTYKVNSRDLAKKIIEHMKGDIK